MRLAIAWSIAQSGVACTVNGVRNVAQLQDNIAAASFELSEDLCRRLDTATREVKEAQGAYPDIYESREKSRTF